jgi:hypothetical protein
MYDIDSAVVCLTLMARSLSILGYRNRSFDAIQQAIGLNRSGSDPFSQSWTYFYGAITYQTDSDRTAENEMVQALMSLAIENGLDFWKAHGVGLKGRLLFEAGKFNEGIALMRVGVEAVRATGSRPSLPYFSGLLAEALGQNGNPSEGLEILEREMTAPEEIPMIYGELCRIRATLLTRLSDRTGEAEKWFRLAVSAARVQNAKLHESRALAAWAAVCEKGDLKEEIQRQLAEVEQTLRLRRTAMEILTANTEDRPIPHDSRATLRQSASAKPTERKSES